MRLLECIAVGALGFIQMLLLIIGLAIIVICGMRLVIEAFRSSILWGVAVLCIHPLMIVFVLRNWRTTKKLFLSSFAGAALIIAGGAIAKAGSIILRH
jgi:hypothetical protein